MTPDEHRNLNHIARTERKLSQIADALRAHDENPSRGNELARAFVEQVRSILMDNKHGQRKPRTRR